MFTPILPGPTSCRTMNPVIFWALPPETLTLADGEIHIWRVPLEHPPVALGLLSTHLSAEEAARL